MADRVSLYEAKTRRARIAWGLFTVAAFAYLIGAYAAYLAG